MRKAYVDVTTRIAIDLLDDNVSIDEVLSEMDYEFTSATDGAVVKDTEITDHEVTEIVEL